MTRGQPQTVFLVHGRNIEIRDQAVLFLQSLGFTVLSWSQCRDLVGRNNPTTFEIVTAGVTRTDATVVILTPDDAAQLVPALGAEKRRYQPRPNVIFELGLAFALCPDNTAVFTVGPVDIHSDFDGINLCSLDDSPSQRRDAVRILRRAGLDPDEERDSWLEPTQSGSFELILRSVSEPLLPGPIEEAETTVADTAPPGADEIDDGSLEPQSFSASEEADDLRGLYTEYVVDSALSTRLSSSKLFEDLRRSLRAGDPVELKYHYVGSRLAEYWTEVVDDPEYGHDLLAYTTSQATGEIVGAASFGPEIDFVSLGPGDGRFDASFLGHLKDYLNVAFYYPVDISQDLLQLAVTNVQRQVCQPGNFPNLRIKAFVADFEDHLVELDFLMRADARPALYALTGFTLGNSREDRLLQSIRGAMRPGDRLLVDARIHSYGRVQSGNDLPKDAVDTLMRPYSSKAVKRFAFGPVEVATDFALSIEDVEIVKQFRPGNVSAVPNALNVLLCAYKMFQKRHERFLAKLGLDVSKRSDQMRVVRMGRRQYVELAMVTFYDFDSLVEWFGQRGFDVLWSRKTSEGLGIFLLAPTTDVEPAPKE